MSVQYLNAIREIEAEVNKLISEDTSKLTAIAAEERHLEIKTKYNTIKQFAAEYKSHHKELTMTSGAESLEHLMGTLREVMEITSKVEAKLSMEE